MAIILDNPVSNGLILDSPVYVQGGSFTGLAVARQYLRQFLQDGAAQDPSGITANDTWVEPVSIELVQNVSVGTLVLQINGLFTYTPPPTYVGYVTFQYRLWELGVASNIGTVTIAVDGNYAGQAVTGTLIPNLAPSVPVLGFTGQVVQSELPKLKYAGTFTGSQSLPFIGNAATYRKEWPGTISSPKFGHGGIAQPAHIETSLNPAAFAIGTSFVQSAQAPEANLFNYPADKAMGWAAQAMPLQVQAQTVATTAPFLFPYPQIVNATFELTSWSATFSFT